MCATKDVIGQYASQHNIHGTVSTTNDGDALSWMVSVTRMVSVTHVDKQVMMGSLLCTARKTCTYILPLL
jgi:hypothetical protein